MLRVQWSSLMSVGNEDIDRDHRALIDIVNRLAAAHDAGDADRMAATIDELIAYAASHFEREEKFMSDCGYPQFDAHRKQHENLTRAVKGLRDRFVAVRGTWLAAEAYAFAVDWLFKHIMHEDRKIGDHIARRAA